MFCLAVKWVSYFIAKDELEKTNECKLLIYILSQSAFNWYTNYYISRMHLATGNDLFCSFITYKEEAVS